MSRLGLSAACAALVLLGAHPAAAQAPTEAARLRAGAPAPEAKSYRLRANALGQARTPTGVIAVQGDLRPTDWARAEALVWGGTGELGQEADVLVGRLTLQHPSRRASLHLGRMVVGPGAVRPVHMDGGHGWVLLPWGMKLETFGGVGVAPRFEERDYDWLVGGRVGQRLGPAHVGVAYLQRRDGGRLADHEVGGDLAVVLGEAWSLNGRAAWDLQNPGFSEALASLVFQPHRAWRLEVYGAHRSPSRILPATSLFSVLGDVAAQHVAGRVRWRAAPRLDVIADGGARSFEEGFFEQARLRAVLRLDDFGRSVLSAQFERAGGPADVAFTGARLTFRWQVAPAWRLASELELVRPDQVDVAERPGAGLDALSSAPDRGEWWPWGLMALEYQPSDQWIVAAAVEASATARFERAVDGLLRATWLWGAP